MHSVPANRKKRCLLLPLRSLVLRLLKSIWVENYSFELWEDFYNWLVSVSLKLSLYIFTFQVSPFFIWKLLFNQVIDKKTTKIVGDITAAKLSFSVCIELLKLQVSILS